MEDIMKKCAIMLVFAYAVVTFLTVTPLAAGFLNADGVKNILVNKIWVEKGKGPFSETFYEWKEDGSVCVRLFEKIGSCDYVGHWELEANRVCYILERRASKSGTKSKCARISKSTTGPHTHEALDDNNVTVFKFTVAK